MPSHDARRGVTVVTGLPRSGTSLVMQLLEAGGLPLLVDDVRAPDEDNPRGYYEYEPVKRIARDTSWLADASGRAVKIVQPLLRFLPADPDARLGFVWVRRDLDEVLASQRVMLERRGERSDAAHQERLRALFAEEAERLERWLAKRPESPVLRLEHARLLDSPDDAAAELGAFCGGSMDVAAMARCIEQALYRQRLR